MPESKYGAGVLGFCETPEEGWAYVQDFYRENKEPLFRKGRGEK